MDSFKFTRAQDPADAIRLASPNAKFIAGGTNLVDLMKMGVEHPAHLIDINPLALDQTEVLNDNIIRVGTLVRNSDLAYHPIIAKEFPLLSQALLSGASPQLRNMATVGGNLMQRTRCPYFYDVAFACNKRFPNAGCAALNGYNRSHAVLGTSNACIATHPSDMCVALVALEATVNVQGSNGSRTIAIGDFHLPPGDTPHHETSLEPGELILSVDLPRKPFYAKSHYLKVRDRASYEFALASAAVAMDIQNGTVHIAKIALGGVGTKPWRAIDAEAVLVGSPANSDNYHKAAEIAMREAYPQKFNGFKIELAKRTLVRALETTAAIA